MFRVDLLKPDGRALWLYARQPIPDRHRGAEPERAAGLAQLAPALASAARRVDRVRLASAASDVSSAAGVEPAGRDDRSVGADGSAGGSVGRRGVRESVSDAERAGARSAGVDRRHATRSWRVRGRGLHAGPDRRRWDGCPWITWRSSSTSGPIAPAALGARDDVAYVFPFENRGVEVGVTLHHPHGQIYAYPFVPPVAARELSQQQAHYDATGRGLAGRPCCAQELDDDARRVIYRGARRRRVRAGLRDGIRTKCGSRRCARRRRCRT